MCKSFGVLEPYSLQALLEWDFVHPLPIESIQSKTSKTPLKNDSVTLVLIIMACYWLISYYNRWAVFYNKIWPTNR